MPTSLHAFICTNLQGDHGTLKHSQLNTTNPQAPSLMIDSAHNFPDHHPHIPDYYLQLSPSEGIFGVLVVHWDIYEYVDLQEAQDNLGWFECTL